MPEQEAAGAHSAAGGTAVTQPHAACRSAARAGFVPGWQISPWLLTQQPQRSEPWPNCHRVPATTRLLV